VLRASINRVSVSGTATPALLWAAGASTLLSLGTALFILEVDSSGAVTNRASVLTPEGHPAAAQIEGSKNIVKTTCGKRERAIGSISSA
jgi:hypothetical protein